MRLLLDVMLGTLATYLRMAGHDAVYALDRGIEADDALLAISREEGRTLLTRDATLSDRADDALLLRGTAIEDQLRELRTAGFDLTLDRPERCSRCNTPLEAVPEACATPEYAPAADETSVWRCPACDQHYWRGSHWDDVRERIASL